MRLIGLGALVMTALALIGLPGRARIVYALARLCPSVRATSHADCPRPLPPMACRYVALGDSFAAGEELFPFDDDHTSPPARCHRSARAYPRLLTWPEGHQPVIEHWACSRAGLHDLTGSPDGPAQFDRVAPAASPSTNTSLVTLTVGGNEIGFRDIVTACVHTGAWFGLGANPRYEPACRASLHASISGKLRNLETRLPAVLVDLRHRAPRATVLVVGYPALVPSTPTNGCEGEITHTDGVAVGFGAVWAVSPDNTRWLAEVLTELNRILASATREAGIAFVGVSGAFAGHGTCARDPWIRGVVVDGTEPSEFSFHPTSAGQVAIARASSDWIRRPDIAGPGRR